ncbi:MAG TPA: hypothetical protein VK453_14375 [Micromonosporaceae bacterium]|nr:hypothetical protein [Micromonosporaceae bacterium]
MQAYVDTFSVPKRGSTWQEYEDAACVEPSRATLGERASSWLAAAVADGASEGFLSGTWARDLVNRFAEAGPTAELPATLAAGVAGWNAVEADYCQGRQEAGDPIAWYEEDKLRKGAYATIIAARLLDGETEGEGRLDVWALGDACLFHVCDDEMVTAFPITDPDEFGTAPALAPSRPVDRTAVDRHIGHITTTWRRGDQLLLASDALACWLLSQAAAGEAPWPAMRALHTAEGITDFAGWVDERRDDGSMRNDDTTLMRIDLI